MRSIAPLLVLALALAAGCTATPYAKPNQDLAAVNAEFTDCYSDGALKANTPPYPDRPLAAVDDAADTCMKQRGYQPEHRFF